MWNVEDYTIFMKGFFSLPNSSAKYNVSFEKYEKLQYHFLFLCQPSRKNKTKTLLKKKFIPCRNIRHARAVGAYNKSSNRESQQSAAKEYLVNSRHKHWEKKTERERVREKFDRSCRSSRAMIYPWVSIAIARYKRRLRARASFLSWRRWVIEAKAGVKLWVAHDRTMLLLPFFFSFLSLNLLVRRLPGCHAILSIYLYTMYSVVWYAFA